MTHDRVLYSGDGPNPLLRSFVEAHCARNPYRPADDYRVEEFSRPIMTTKNSPVFGMHPYHLGKKPHDAIQAYVRHFTTEGDLVLDPFCGSGSTALAALTSGRNAVAIDASPAATFITRFYLSRCDPEVLWHRFNVLCQEVDSEIRYLYDTTCHKCGRAGTIHYVIYSNEYHCAGCGRAVTLYEASLYNQSCCPHCLSERGEHRRIGSMLKIAGYVPVAVNFSCHGRCRPKRMTRSVFGPKGDRDAFAAIDLARIREIERAPIPYPHPIQFMMNESNPDLPWGDEWRPSRDFRRVSQLFTYRNLRALAAFMHAAGNDYDLKAVITAGMTAVSRKAQHLDGGGGYIPGNWSLPPVSKQRNVLESLTRVFKRTVKAKAELARTIQTQSACISTQSATDMDALPECSVDYIFTDPPYGGSVQYGELNFVWESWLGFNTSWHDSEIIINATRRKSVDHWARMMRLAASECHRVLKPGRWLSLCWHDASSMTWRLVQQIFADAGFVIGDLGHALSIDTDSETYNQRVSDKVVRRDLVINFRKPQEGERLPAVPSNSAGGESFEGRACRTIGAYVLAHPGATKDRIYDHFISVMIRCGSLENHNFDALLSRVAVRVSTGGTGWVLKSDTQ
ncbi:MAG: DNA methyltransferase [Desulfomonilaceae bacterium]|nr:DNA methyltransferase [Desulfomonilaceae bacterium]